MRRITAFLSAGALLLGLLVWTPAAWAEESALSAQALAQAAVAASGRELGDLEPMEEDFLAAWTANAYGIPREDWVDAAVYRGRSAEAYEVAVLALADGADADEAREALEGYIHSQEGVFTGYAPEQAAIAANGLVLAEDGYVMLLICEEPERAGDGAMALLHGEAEPTPEPTAAPAPTPPRDPVTGRVLFIDPEEDDMTVYDTSAILEAWERGDPSGLSDYDRAIYDRAARALGEALADGMTDLEKERALYAWATWNVTYDWSKTDLMEETARDAYTPYGAFVNGKAVCLGMASAFKLLMNMVRLDGAWYCVDPTWDMRYTKDPGKTLAEDQWGPGYWKYFNVTSDFMAQTDHQWDYASVPEALVPEEEE